MNTQIQIFKNSQFGEVRVTEIDGKTYFVGNDVAKALGYASPKDAISRHCKGATFHRLPDSQGFVQDTKVIPEGDIYRLAAKSELPGAEAFESWIFDEVLPTIRKTGGYMVGKPLTTAEQLLKSAELMVEYDARLIAIEQKMETLQGAGQAGLLPAKFNRFDDLATINELSKRLCQNGVETGQNRLFQWLVKNHYLMVAGKRWNTSRQRYENRYIPTQEAAEMKLFAITRCGSVKVTEKGMDYFLSKTIH